MLNTLLATKLYVPRTRPALVQRTSLLAALDAGLGRKVTLVVAPAGFGKTTLLSSWARNAPIPMAWVSLDESDNDADRFISYLVASLQAIHPEANMGVMVEAMRRSPQPVPRQSILTALVNEMDYFNKRFGIVLDDYHLIDHQDIHEVTSYIIKYLPPNVHLVIAGRSEPPIPIPQLRARDYLNEIRLDKLRFNSDEAEQFLSEVMDLELSPEGRATLIRHMEGWPAGLHLAAISLKDHPDPDRVISDWSVTQRFVVDFLAAEVLEKLPEEVQSFLLSVSTLDELNAPLCRAVSGRAHTSEMLKKLSDDDLFLFEIDRQPGWYRFHPIFREFLQDQLLERQPDMSGEYRRRAAKWFADQKMPGKAIEYALSCQAFEEAAEWMGPEVQKAIVGGEFSTIVRWVDALPAEVMHEHPNLHLAMAWAVLIRDPIRFWSHVELNMARIYEGFGLDSADLLDALERLDPGSEERIRLCELALLQAFVSRTFGELEDAVDLFTLVLRTLPVEAYFQRGVGLAGLGSTYLRTGAAKPAEGAFGQAAEVSGQAGSLYGVVVSLAFQALMQSWQGRLKQAANTYRRAIDLVPEDEGVFLPLSGMPWVGLGDIMREQNHLQAARQLLDQGIIRGIQTGDIDALRDGYVILSRINLASGDEAGAKEAMSKAVQVAQETGSSECINEAAAWRARLDIAVGNLHGAADWAIRRGVGSGDPTLPEEPLAEVEQMTLARLLMNQGKYPQALDVIQPLLEKFESDKRDQAVIETTVLKSLCNYKSGYREQALGELAEALRLAGGEGYERVFLDEGPVIAAMLRSAGAEGHRSAYAGHLLNEFSGEEGQQALPDPLSERELEVVELIYRGLNNQQIADELMIALSTVKTHVNRIYSKLGVKNRSQAMARVRELRLLA